MGPIKALLCLAILAGVVMAVSCQDGRRRRPRPTPRPTSAGRPSSSSSSSRNRQRGSTAHTCRGRTTFSMTAAQLESTPFNFRCPRGPVAEVTAVGVKGNCRGYSPLLLSTVDRCTFNATCTIPFTATPIETPAASNRGEFTCLGQQPDRYEISYACLKKNTDVKNLLDETRQRTNKRVGVVKSHRLYPWSYRTGSPQGSISLVQPRSSYTTLWITVRRLNILEDDILFLSWYEGSRRRRRPGNEEQQMYRITPFDSTFHLPNATSVNLTFLVDYEKQSRSAEDKDHGFLLCYQWLRPSGRLRRGSACSRILKPARCRATSGRSRTSGSNSRTRPTNTRTRPTNTNTNTNTRTRPTNTRTRPTNTRTRPTNTRTRPTNTRTRPTNTRTRPTNTRTRPTNTRTRPTNTRTRPTNTRTRPTNTRTRPTNTRTRPTNTRTRPTTRPTNTRTRPTTRPTDTRTRPTNTRTRPTNTRTRPNNSRTRTSTGILNGQF